jgi:transketolase
VENLGGNPAQPFAVFPEVSRMFARVARQKSAEAQAHRAVQAQWEAGNPELAAKLQQFISGELPPIDFAAIAQKANVATRAASGAVLAHFARTIDTMVVCSADLSNSDKTEDFLNQTSAFEKGNFNGKFLHAGVAELTMAAICNGLALHGLIPVCGTFFVFSDYMKPAIRLAALMGLPVKYVWTHDSFRVGEDGPTHQPIEHEAQIRLMERIANEHGGHSVLVLRPSDAAETTVAWKLALENTKSPTALLLTRQNVPDIAPSNGSSRFQEALAGAKGAYVLGAIDEKPDLVLVANGSEAATIAKAAETIKQQQGLKVRVVVALSEGLFKRQSAEYRQSVLPYGLPTLGVTVGLPDALQGLVGPLGKVLGMQRFGASAPYQVLEEKFGYTVPSIVAEAGRYLKEYQANLAALKAL